MTSDPMADLWPEFRVPSVPETGLLATIARFAAALEAKTKRLVRARLRPCPENGRPTSYSFVIYAAQEIGTQITWFVVERVPPIQRGVISISAGDEKETFSNENQLRLYLRSIATSQELRARIVEMMVLAEEMAPTRADGDQPR